MAEPPVSSSSSLPPSGDPSPEVSSEASQPTRSANFLQSLLSIILPLATQSPLDEPFDINWQPRDVWSSFGSEEEFPTLTSESPLLATALLGTIHRLFHDQMSSSDMDSSSPVSSEELYVSTREYYLPLENFPYVSNQPSSQPVSLPHGYRTLG